MVYTQRALKQITSQRGGFFCHSLPHLSDTVVVVVFVFNRNSKSGFRHVIKPLRLRLRLPGRGKRLGGLRYRLEDKHGLCLYPGGPASKSYTKEGLPDCEENRMGIL